MTANHPHRPTPKNRRPGLTTGQLIALVSTITALINALAYLRHG